MHTMEETLNNNNNNNKGVVEALYKALACHDTSTLSTLLATDLEWWFHGPPHREHMMRVLTAGNHDDDQWSSWFEFKPRSITAIDEERVIVEGWEGARSSYWVHVWTVRDGRLTQLREYFNTWLTVRDLRSVHVNISRQVREINNAN
ncbi:hypothetical protein Syun_000143 [Stephania yunnanensis]|uniref:Wound-induced protein 1 n=1 Tax=Stephania yunnanensis TaxID=152371 RepID=A0AAP0LCM9_9MAGN